MDEPVDVAKLKALVRAIVDEGRVEFSTHAMEQLAKDDLDLMDAHNVLRGGWFEEGEGKRRLAVQGADTAHLYRVLVPFR